MKVWNAEQSEAFGVAFMNCWRGRMKAQLPVLALRKIRSAPAPHNQGHFMSSSTGGWAHRGDAKQAPQGEHQPCGLRLQAQEMVAGGMERRALALFWPLIYRCKNYDTNRFTIKATHFDQSRARWRLGHQHGAAKRREQIDAASLAAGLRS